MTRDDEIEEFRRRWIARLKAQAKVSKNLPGYDAWEGYEAYRELSDTENLWIVIPTPEAQDWPFPWLTKKLTREVRFYKLFCQEIVPTNLSFERAVKVLSAAEGKLKRATILGSSAKAELDAELNKCASVLERARIAVEQRRESYWEDSLFAEPEERAGWMIEFDAENQVRSIPPVDLVDHERIFEKAKYPRKPVKKLDLDARFQVRVATILRSYLQRDFKISLKTISRLTLLTYICGNLGHENEDNLAVGSREITVGAIDQKLREAKLK